MEGIRILLVDTHELVHRGVRSMLEQEEDMEIVGDYFSTEEALAQMGALSPNVILMDAEMPGIGGVEVIQLLRQKRMSCNVIMLTPYENCLAEALEAGAAGYLLEDIKSQELAQAIRRVYQGEVVIDEHLVSTPRVPKGGAEYLLSEDNGSDTLIIEIELIILPPFDAAQLLRFVCQVEEVLEATVVQQVGSWDRGTAITTRLRKVTPLVDILNRLGKMPDVEDTREWPKAKYKPFSFPKKIIANPETHFKKELLVTLKQADTVKQFELAGVSS